MAHESDLERNDKITDEWYKKAAMVNNVDQLKDFIDYIYSSSSMDYAESIEAVTAIAVAASWCANGKYSLTGYQASIVGLLYLLHWTYAYKDCVGISVRDYTNMLYPQYAPQFEKVIEKDMFEALQEAAQKKLDEGCGADFVRDHWQSIVDGIVPFGYKLVDRI